jgi:hypothetical protein
MALEKNVNGYLIKQLQDTQWWVCSVANEAIAGPFATEQSAVDVASVLHDQRAAPSRRSAK